MNYYQNKRVFIVGGSSGIGLAIAEQLMEQGAHLHIFARCISALNEALIVIEKQRINPQQQLGATSLDVTDESSIVNAFANACAITDKAINDNNNINENKKNVDIIINCAGAARPDYYLNITAKDFSNTINRNLIGVRNVSYAAIPYLQSNAGQLVNTASIAGFMGIFGYTDYCASKFGIVGFCEALQMELKADGIAISVLCPPDTQTPGFDDEELKKPWQTRAISGNNKLRSAEFVAKVFLKKLPRKKSIICCGFDSQATLWLKRFFPRLVTAIMHRSINKANPD